MPVVAHLSMYDEEDRAAAYSVPVPFIPQPGYLIEHHGELWEVVSQPQVMLGDRTLSFHADYPVRVDVRVRRGQGIHQADMADETLDPHARYEYAKLRYANAVQDYPRVKALAARLLAEADEEFRAAEAVLNEFEVSPGVPKPEFRERM